MGAFRALFAVGFMALVLGETRGQEPPKVETLPPPRAAEPMPLMPSPLPGRFMPLSLPEAPPQFGRRDVWQTMAPNRFGQFVPRVIYSPYGNSYYQYNGRPFPWTTTMPNLYMPYVVD